MQQLGGGKSQYYKKIVNRLLVPYFATCVVYLLYDIAFTYYKGMFDPLRVVRSIGAMIIGVQSFDDGCGCVSMWFVYALFIIKLIDAFIPNRFKPVFAILCIACAIPLSKYEITWAVTDIFLAYPLYVIGQFISKRGESVIEWLRNTNVWFKLLVMVLPLASTYIVSTFNGFVKMYMGGYGNNLFLFFIGAFTGTLAIVILSLLLENVRWKHLLTISTGTIIILEFQAYFLFVIRHILVVLLKLDSCLDMISMISSAFIMLSFIPIIKFLNKYLPVFSGKSFILK